MNFKIYLLFELLLFVTKDVFPCLFFDVLAYVSLIGVVLMVVNEYLEYKDEKYLSRLIDMNKAKKRDEKRMLEKNIELIENLYKD